MQSPRQACRDTRCIRMAVFRDGEPAPYILGLAKVDPFRSSIFLGTTGGIAISKGDSEQKFTCRSIPNALALPPPRLIGELALSKAKLLWSRGAIPATRPTSIPKLVRLSMQMFKVGARQGPVFEMVRASLEKSFSQHGRKATTVNWLDRCSCLNSRCFEYFRE